VEGLDCLLAGGDQDREQGLLLCVGTRFDLSRFPFYPAAETFRALASAMLDKGVPTGTEGRVDAKISSADTRQRPARKTPLREKHAGLSWVRPPHPARLRSARSCSSDAGGRPRLAAFPLARFSRLSRGHTYFSQ
jgi:hypothetical protein